MGHQCPDGTNSVKSINKSIMKKKNQKSEIKKTKGIDYEKRMEAIIIIMLVTAAIMSIAQ